MRSIIIGAVAALLVLFPLVGAQAQEGGKNKAAGTKYESAKGLYVQGGFVVSKTNTGGGDANLGFDITGGYRFLPWLGADADFYWAGRDQGAVSSRIWAITFNGKIYPMGLLSPKSFDAFQPYAVFGMGGGGGGVKNGPSTGTFIFRMGAGLDWLMTDNFGLYSDVSLHATPGFKGGGNGGATGVFQLGAKFTF